MPRLRAHAPQRTRAAQAGASAATAIAASAGAAVAMGVALAALNGTNFGFLSLLIALGVGIVMAEVVTRTSGYYRGRESGVIAAGGMHPDLRRRVAGRCRSSTSTSVSGSNWITLQFVFGIIAAVFAYRQGRIDPQALALARVRRVVVGGLVGGAVVVLDRRRRQREPAGAGQRATDQLAPFEGAPCYREGFQERLTPGGRRLAAAHPERDARDVRLPRDEQLELHGAMARPTLARRRARRRAAASRSRLACGKSWAWVACCAPAPALQRQPHVGTPISTRERGAARSTVRRVCFQNASEATGPGSLRGPCSFQARTSNLAGRARARRS